MKTIVTLIDFSDLTSTLIEHSEIFAKALNSRVVLFHVVPKEHVILDLGIASPVVPIRASPESIAVHFESLKTIGAGLRQSGVDVVVEQIANSDIHKILRECEDLKADMIIVGSHNHSAIHNWFMGSFTSDIIKKAICPVLVVPVKSEQ